MLQGDRMLIGLTSIPWRESWKYGERAYRYCMHDCGHAIAGLSYAARSLGWHLKLLDKNTDEVLGDWFGTCDLETDPESEHTD